MKNFIRSLRAGAFTLIAALAATAGPGMVSPSAFDD